MTIETRPLTVATFPDLAALMAAPGGPRHCWCRVWRGSVAGMNDGPPAAKSAVREAALADEVRAGARAGLLAYVGGAPAGWISAGPRESFLRLDAPSAPPGEVWSVVCFFVPRARRGQGIGRALLHGAITQAREAGAQWVEAYPVDPESPSYRFMGFVPFFRREGFAGDAPLGTRRRIMRLNLQG